MPRRKPGPFPIAVVLEALRKCEIPRVYGTGYRKVLCPFHDERNKSASVSQYGFKCFGCERVGDAIKLVMEEEDLSYADAVSRCEEITGITGGAVSRADSWAGDLLPD